MRKVTKILSHITCTYDTLFSYLFVVLQRDQINLATSFVDASFLYGSSDTKANIVRETNSCKLFYFIFFLISISVRLDFFHLDTRARKNWLLIIIMVWSNEKSNKYDTVRVVVQYQKILENS